MSEPEYEEVFNSPPGPHDPFVTLVLRISRVALVIEAAEACANVGEDAPGPPELRRAIEEMKTALYANCCDVGDTPIPRVNPDRPPR